MREPNRFTGLHSHTNFSIGDACGLPQEHIDFAISNGSDSLALTDHGTQAGVSHQQIKAKELKKKGIKFKAIPGVEAYFIDSLSDWRSLHAEAKASGSLAPKKKAKTKIELIGNELASTEEEIEEISKQPVDENEQTGTVVEDETESKSSKWANPLYQRNHLVLLPKNSAGIKALFRLTSESYINGFYRYPRMDFDTLRQNVKGNIIGFSACIGGTGAKIVFDEIRNISADLINLGPDTPHDFEKVQSNLKTYSEKFVEVLGEGNYFLELQFNRLPIQSLVNLHLLECSRRTGIPLVATADAHYSNPAHWKEREIYKAMAWSSKTKGTFDVEQLPKRIEDLKCELYPKNEKQMWSSYLSYSDPYREIFKKYDVEVCEAIERTHDIAHQMIGELEIDRSIKLPTLSQISDLPSNKLQELIDLKQGDETKAAFTELVRVAIDGLIWRGKDKDPVYVARLHEELEVIKGLKFSKYFLTYWKIMSLLSEELICGAGRGSAAGSLLSYCLNITQIDPIRFNLLFARFLSKGKLSYPDIDSDVSDREKAILILSGYFGRENVIAVSNFNQLQLRSLIKDVSKLYGVSYEEINPLTSRIEMEVLAEKKKEPGFDKAVWVLTFEDAIVYSDTFIELMKKYPEFETTIKVLFRQMKSLSRHAGGVILASNAKEAMPIIASGGQLQTPWPEGINYRHLEEFGLLKFDILGLGTLKMFEECTRKILLKEGNKNPSFTDIKKWFWDHLHPDTNPMMDEKVYKYVFWNNHASGIFQFVQKNTQEFMRQMKPTCIEDIAVATSIYRPGPLGLGVDKQFLQNRAKPESVVYQHPLLEEVYKETSGLLVFQEQLQMIYHKLAGVSLESTDNVRKSFTKKNISNKEKAKEERDLLRSEFLTKCKEANNIKPDISGDIFDNMEALVAYSFNKSHAVSYAIATFQCIHGQTRIFDWDRKKYITVAKAFKEGRTETIACYDEENNKTIPGKIKKIIRTTGAKNLNLKMAFVLRTETGKKLVCSKDHPILTISGIYKKLEELNAGDFIACEKHVLSTYGVSRTEETKKAISESVMKNWTEMDFEKRKTRLETLLNAGDAGREAAVKGAKLFWKIMPKDEKRRRILKMQDAAFGTNGWSTRFVGHAMCGHKVSSSNELALCNWLYSHGLEHETQVPRDTFGFCDVVCKGVCIEFDGLGRSDEYFEKKYGDEPFIKLICKKAIPEELNFLLQDEPIINGKEIVYEKITSITQWKETVMYDISMESNPHNFLANNIVVHNCAWFLTYYPDEWVTTYLDYCTEGKGSTTNQEDPKSVAIKEAKKLDYKISKPDINNSSYLFTMHPVEPKVLVPGFSSLKYVGKTVLWELAQYKPYKTPEDLILNQNGTWRHSKFNKRALATLISLEALDSMDLIGPNKSFNHYKQMHHVLIENYDLLKRTSARKKNNDSKEVIKRLIEESKEMSDWTTEEKIKMQQELAGSVDFSLIVPEEVQEALEKENILTIDNWIPDSRCWAVVSSAILAVTKTGKPYLKLKLFGETMREHMCMIWNYKGTGKGVKQNDIVVVEFTGKTDFGFSTFPNKIQKINIEQWLND